MDERELVKWLITTDNWKEFDYNRALQLWKAQPQAYRDKITGIYQRTQQTKPMQEDDSQGMLKVGESQYPAQWAAIGYGHTVDGQPFQVLSPTLPSSNLYTPEISAYIYENVWGKNLITGEEFLLNEEQKAGMGLNYNTVYQESMKASAYNQITAQNMQLTPEMKSELDRQLQQLPPGSAFDVEGAFNQLSKKPPRQGTSGNLIPVLPRKEPKMGELLNRAERLARF